MSVKKNLKFSFLTLYLFVLFFSLINVSCSPGFKVINQAELPSNDDDINNPGDDPDEEDPPTNPNPNPDPDPPSPPVGLVPAFVSTGKMRSTMYSCNGTTWKGYRTQNSNARCENMDCDHSPYSSLGIAYGSNTFVATYGWGYGGNVEISTDAINWTTVHTGGYFAGVAFGNNTFVLNEWQPLYSTNGGITWSNSQPISFLVNNPRRIHFANTGPGVFITQAEAGGTFDLLISTDSGRSFTRPPRPSNCGVGAVAHNNNSILMLSRSLCRSTNNGQTWQEITPRPSGNVIIHNGTEFRIYSSGQIHRSIDGTSWTTTPIRLNNTNSNLHFDHVAFHPTLNKYVGIFPDDYYYERTRYFHSDDGLNWQEITRSAANVPLSPHPITQITTGFLPASSCQ